MLYYNARDWYWIVGGNGPHLETADAAFTGDESRVFSSAVNRYVAGNDPTYVAWRDGLKARNEGVDPTTRIDTEANLAAVLRPYDIIPNFT